ncbi:hypothetical protein BC829DRAFT_81230 [Chytridium lagenaria]|nr:hypothetical protein BC829DRAFT_81230 [Chytridium lagenaria]
MATCRPFPGDTPCGTLFEGLNHILAGDVGNVLRSINSTSTVKSSFTSDTRYACIDSPALDQAMQSLRYQTSLFCVRYALNATLNGCQPDPYPARNYLCPDQATLALDSFRALITNTELCPSVDITDPNSHAGATFQGLSLIVDRNNAAVDSSTCFSGVAEDVGLAGYSSYANAVAGCQNSNDAICAAFLQANGLASTPNGPAEPGPAPPGGALQPLPPQRGHQQPLTVLSQQPPALVVKSHPLLPLLQLQPPPIWALSSVELLVVSSLLQLPSFWVSF